MVCLNSSRIEEPVCPAYSSTPHITRTRSAETSRYRHSSEDLPLFMRLNSGLLPIIDIRLLEIGVDYPGQPSQDHQRWR